MHVVAKSILVFVVTLLYVTVARGTIPLLQTGIDFIENGVNFLRQSIEWWNEDPVAFAHRVYGSTVSLKIGLILYLVCNRF